MPKVQMPQLGESVAEGTIGKWLKKPGDHVAKYEPIVEVITDKVNAEVPSPYEGTLTEILVQEGETVPNNTEIAVIESADGAVDAPAAEAAPAETAVPPTPAVEVAEEPPAGGNGPAGSNERPEPSAPSAPPPSFEQPVAQPAPPMASAATAVAAPAVSGGNGAAPSDGNSSYSGPTTPAVRRLAREHGVDLALIAGTGHGGRVTRDDVMKFVESGGAAAAPAQAAPSTPAPGLATAMTSAPAAQSAAQAPSTPAAPSPVAQGDSLKQPSPMRKAIATQMSKSVSIPVAYTVVEVDMSGVVALRDKTKGQYQAQEGISLTFDAFVAKATVEALKKHADFNAHYTEEGHWRRKAINLGVAVAVEDGLVVPVIHEADTLSIHGLNKAIRDLAERSRGGKLRLDDIQGGTFTLDNTGWTGSIITQPIVGSPGTELEFAL